MSSGISIEPFRGDLEGLERMAHSSWRDEYGISSFPNLYRPDFLKYLFDRVPDKNHFLAAYKQNEIVAFLGNLPQRFHFQGKTYRATYACLLVTRKEFLRQGMASAIIQEALRLNQTYKYDFALFSLETGHSSTQLTKKLEETGHPVEWVKKMHVMARVLDLKRAAYSEGIKFWEKLAIQIIGGHKKPKAAVLPNIREYKPEDLDHCLVLLNQYKDKVRLALVWDHDELGLELDYPGVSKTLVYEKEGKVAGLINFILHEHIGKTKELWAWINHVAYHDLKAREQYLFIQGFLRYIKESNCLGAIEWTKKYYPQSPLYRSHFFPYFRAVNLVSWIFNTNLSLRNIQDVYEIQI